LNPYFGDADLFETVKSYFLSSGMPFAQHDTLPVLRIPFRSTHGEWVCFARVANSTQYIFLAVYPDHVPPAKRQVMAEFITRANFGLNVGCFEMDFSDGEVRFRVGVDLTNDRLSDALITNMLHAATSMLDGYFPGIQALIQQDITAEAAIALVEEDPDDDEDDADDD
jgi:hypothetical protein